MRKYENVDVIAALGAVVELNTEHYKSDFRYDVERFKEAAKHPDGENNRLLWLSRHSGTWCFPERDVYIKDTEAFNCFTSYGKLLGSPEFYQHVIVDDRVLAYAVTVKGFGNGRIKGDLYELDYRDFIRQINKNALPWHTVTAKYEDGTALTLPHEEYDGKRERLRYQHGEVTDFRKDPEDLGALRDVLKDARDKREKEVTPVAFKLRVQNPKPRKPSIRDDLRAGEERLARERAAAPQRAAAKTKNTSLEV
jgi:hypothetical protein